MTLLVKGVALLSLCLGLEVARIHFERTTRVVKMKSQPLPSDFFEKWEEDETHFVCVRVWFTGSFWSNAGYTNNYCLMDYDLASEMRDLREQANAAGENIPGDVTIGHPYDCPSRRDRLRGKVPITHE